MTIKENKKAKEEEAKKTLGSHFFARYGEMPTSYYFCPGRVNFIGEHIDYNGGYVFPAAIELGIMVAVSARGDGRIVGSSRTVTPDFDLAIATLPEKKDETLGWANYVVGVIAALRGEGYPIPGMNLLFDTDLPEGAGLSSSAALEVLTGFVALRMGGTEEVDIDRTWLALLCQKVENNFVGVNSGIMDQFAVANGRAGYAMLLDCTTLACEQVPLHLEGATLLILDSGKARALADSKYNERRAECERALEYINEHSETPYADLAHTGLEKLEVLDDETLRKRARHVITEQARVIDAVEALKSGQSERVGQLLSDSHASLRYDYQVTGPELDALIDAAQAQNSCLGARMTGAGFGGCGVALVRAGSEAEFRLSVIEAYKLQTGLTAKVYSSEASAGVREIIN
jgi:galactokinase